MKIEIFKLVKGSAKWTVIPDLQGQIQVVSKSVAFRRVFISSQREYIWMR